MKWISSFKYATVLAVSCASAAQLEATVTVNGSCAAAAPDISATASDANKLVKVDCFSGTAYALEVAPASGVVGTDVVLPQTVVIVTY